MKNRTRRRKVSAHAKERYKERQKRIRQRKWRNCKYKNSMKVIIVVAASLCVGLGFGTLKLYRKNTEYQEKIIILQEKIDAAEDYAKELSELDAYMETDQYIETIAREKLKLVYPNEIIFIAK